MNIEEMKEKLDRVKEIQDLQRDRGYNTLRKGMIEEILYDLQKEIVWGLVDNAKSP